MYSETYKYQICRRQLTNEKADKKTTTPVGQKHLFWNIWSFKLASLELNVTDSEFRLRLRIIYSDHLQK